MNKHYYISNLKISTTSLNVIISTIIEGIDNNKKHHIAVANIRIARYAAKNSEFTEFQNSSLFTIPDGMPLVWICKAAGYKQVSRITGYNLMERIFSEKEYSHFFIGDTEETFKKMKKAITVKHPNLHIAGYISPPFKAFDQIYIESIAGELNKQQPDFIWVGMGSPKQDFFIKDLMQYLDHGIFVGVGAAFRFFAGEYKDTHPLIKNLGLEGIVWRIKKSPKRLLKYPQMAIFIFTSIIKAFKYRLFSRK